MHRLRFAAQPSYGILLEEREKLVHYRIYLLGSTGQFAAAEHFEAADDIEAKQTAADLHGLSSDTFAGYELWRGRQLIVRSTTGHGSLPSWADWQERRRRHLLDLEDRLARSFECVRTSRQLMEAMDNLRAGMPTGMGGGQPG